MGEYQDKWKDPRWQKVRLEILSRDNFSCRLCVDYDSTLAVHHIEYTMDEPWDEPFCNLITLCEDCHSIFKHCRTPKQREKFNRLLAFSPLWATREKGWCSPQQSEGWELLIPSDPMPQEDEAYFQ